MTTSESWAICAAFIGSGISWLGPGVWQQHYPLPGNGWGASVDWLLAMLPGICGSGRCQLVHVGLSTAGGSYANLLRPRYVDMWETQTFINVYPPGAGICICI
jgi:hypothetical protein